MNANLRIAMVSTLTFIIGLPLFISLTGYFLDPSINAAIPVETQPLVDPEFKDAEVTGVYKDAEHSYKIVRLGDRKFLLIWRNGSPSRVEVEPLYTTPVAEAP